MPSLFRSQTNSTRNLLCLALLLGLTACGGDDADLAPPPPPPPPAATDGRLLLMDGAALDGVTPPQVIIYDLDASQVAGTLTLPAIPDSVKASPNGAFGILTPGGPGETMRFISSGISGTNARTAPQLLAYELPTEDTWPFTVHGDWAALFEFSGVTRFVRLDSRLQTGAPITANIDSGVEHFGFGAAMGDTLFATVADPDTGVATGIAAYSSSGVQIGGPYPCSADAGGRAVLTDVIVFTCFDGLLVVRSMGGILTSEKVAYPTADRFVGDNFFAVPALGVFVGDYRYQGSDHPEPPSQLLRFNPSTNAFSTMPLNKDFWAMGVEAGADGKRAAVLDGAFRQASNVGNLRVVNVETWQDEGEVAVPGLDYTGPWGRFSRMAVGRDHAYITAPATGEVVRVRLSTKAVSRVVVGGTPGEIAVMRTD